MRRALHLVWVVVGLQLEVVVEVLCIYGGARSGWRCACRSGLTRLLGVRMEWQTPAGAKPRKRQWLGRVQAAIGDAAAAE